MKRSLTSLLAKLQSPAQRGREDENNEREKNEESQGYLTHPCKKLGGKS